MGTYHTYAYLNMKYSMKSPAVASCLLLTLFWSLGNLICTRPNLHYSSFFDVFTACTFSPRRSFLLFFLLVLRFIKLHRVRESEKLLHLIHPAALTEHKSLSIGCQLLLNLKGLLFEIVQWLKLLDKKQQGRFARPAFRVHVVRKLFLNGSRFQNLNSCHPTKRDSKM